MHYTLFHELDMFWTRTRIFYLIRGRALAGIDLRGRMAPGLFLGGWAGKKGWRPFPSQAMGREFPRLTGGEAPRGTQGKAWPRLSRWLSY